MFCPNSGPSKVQSAPRTSVSINVKQNQIFFLKLHRITRSVELQRVHLLLDLLNGKKGDSCIGGSSNFVQIQSRHCDVVIYFQCIAWTVQEGNLASIMKENKVFHNVCCYKATYSIEEVY